MRSEENMVSIIQRQAVYIKDQLEIQRKVISWIFRDTRRTKRFSRWWWKEVKKGKED